MHDVVTFSSHHHFPTTEPNYILTVKIVTVVLLRAESDGRCRLDRLEALEVENNRTQL